MKKYLILMLVTTFAQAADKPPGNKPAMDKPSDEMSISIHGNQEQPTVMHIVPWQEAGDNKIIQDANKPPLQHLFQQIERSEHQREVGYLLGNEKPEKNSR